MDETDDLNLIYKDYDKEVIEHLQEVLLEMFKDFIKICNNNNIKYFLHGGTNIGAVRHNGFIPWDDEIDVALLREDYEKLIKMDKKELESVFTKNEKGVRKQLKETITKVFPDVTENDVDLFYNKRSDFAHGDIVFPDYYKNLKDTHHWSDLTNAAQKSTALLIMTLRELVKNNAIKILIDKQGNIVFEKHQLPY